MKDNPTDNPTERRRYIKESIGRVILWITAIPIMFILILFYLVKRAMERL